MAHSARKNRPEPRKRNARPKPSIADRAAVAALDVMDTREAAMYLNLSPEFLEIGRSRRSDGPAYTKLSRRVLYRRADLDAWLSARQRGGVA